MNWHTWVDHFQSVGHLIRAPKTYGFITCHGCQFHANSCQKVDYRWFQFGWWERLSEHSLAIEKRRRRQTWLSREDRLCAHCEVETELHFLTSCQIYDHIRDTHIHQITQIHKEFEKKSNFDKLPYLLGEIPQCAVTAARFVTSCHKKRATSEEQTPL
jgi:hypothetical protein